MGAAFHLNIVRYNTFDDYLAAAGAREFYLFRLRNAEKLTDQGQKAQTPFSLVFGQ